MKMSVLKKISSLLGRMRLILLILVASLMLSGCVRYDVGVNYDSPNHGTLVQHIKLGERFLSFSGDSAQEWLTSIERRARQLEGKSQRLSDTEIVVKIPFNNGKELETKFNKFFQPPTAKKNAKLSKSGEELPKISSNFLLNENNFLLFVRQRLIYDVDLRSLALIASNNSAIVNPSSVLDLEFNLNTPWGAKNIEKSPNAIPVETSFNGHQLTWKLQPGQLNHIEAVFWLPSPLGWGTLAIILFVWAGYYLRYTFMPAPTTVVQTPPAPTES